MSTDLPYTDDDLRAEAARQHADLTEEPDFGGVGETVCRVLGRTPAAGHQDEHLPATLADLAQRWEQMAKTTQAAIDIDPLGGDVEAAQHERVHVYRTVARDLRDVLRTGRPPHDLMTAAELEQHGTPA